MSTRKPSWKTVAKKLFGREATYRGGKGQYAFVTPCTDLHYSLWWTLEDLHKKTRLVRGGCGSDICNPKNHYIVDLSEVGVSHK